jgi:hypothetical protein
MAGRSAQTATTAGTAEDSTKHANAAGTSSTTTTNAKPAPVERNVHWVDMHGYELAQVREFEPRCALLSPLDSFRGFRRANNTLDSSRRRDRMAVARTRDWCTEQWNVWRMVTAVAWDGCESQCTPSRCERISNPRRTCGRTLEVRRVPNGVTLHPWHESVRSSSTVALFAASSHLPACPTCLQHTQ